MFTGLPADSINPIGVKLPFTQEIDLLCKLQVETMFAGVGIPMLGMFGCGASSVTSNSRMCWSFSRDGGLPFGRYLSAVNKT